MARSRGRRASASGFLLDALRRRPVGHAVLNGLVIVLFLSGAGMFAYPFFTDVYTEQVIQQRLEDEFVQLQVQTFDEWEDSVRGQTGTALTKIVIPDIGVETLVVEGTSPAALRAGAGADPLLAQQQQDRLGLEAGEADVRRVREALGATAVNGSVRNGAEDRFLQSVAQGGDDLILAQRDRQILRVVRPKHRGKLSEIARVAQRKEQNAA